MDDKCKSTQLFDGSSPSGRDCDNVARYPPPTWAQIPDVTAELAESRELPSDSNTPIPICKDNGAFCSGPQLSQKPEDTADLLDTPGATSRWDEASGVCPAPSAPMVNCFLKAPPSRQDAMLCDEEKANSTQRQQAMWVSATVFTFVLLVGGNPGVTHRLAKIAGIREYLGRNSRVGCSFKPSLFPIRDASWGDGRPLKEETLYYLAFCAVISHSKLWANWCDRVMKW